MACKHERLDFNVELVRREDDGSILVDVWCEACGKSGTAHIEPSTVQWGDEDEKAGEHEEGDECPKCRQGHLKARTIESETVSLTHILVCDGCGETYHDASSEDDLLTDENGEPRTCILTGEPGENADDCKTHHHEVTCSICKNECAVETAHLHQGEWIGDECCWDDRLKASE